MIRPTIYRKSDPVMNFVVFDLEWNQPLSYQSRVYREVGDRLIFEMIQIGAVKLDENLNVVDSISIPIRPTHYVRIHPRIHRMTHLGPEELCDAPQFPEAMAQFEAWWGEDVTLLTWGCDDISVLQQNIDFFGYKTQLPPMCDIQKMFSDHHRLKERAGLKLAMDMMSIEPDESKEFHNAENDAYYTALVFKACESPMDVLKYPQKPKQLIHANSEKHKGPEGLEFASLEEAISSEAALHPRCPVCSKVAALDGDYVPQAANKYISLARCRAHGNLLVRLHLRVTDDNMRLMYVTVAKAAPSNCAYVRTKRLQVADRLARYRAAHNGQNPDMEEALLNADRSSVPFDE